MECRDVEKIHEIKIIFYSERAKREAYSPWSTHQHVLVYEIVRLDERDNTPWRDESCVKANLETRQRVLFDSSRTFSKSSSSF